MSRPNHLTKIISQQRQLASEVAYSCVKDILYVISASIASQLYERGYGRDGIKRFMDGVFSYVQEFVDNAKGEYIDEKGYTQHRNIKYAAKRLAERQEEIMGKEPLIYDIGELVELIMKK